MTVDALHEIKWHSQAGQDRFAAEANGWKRGGTYLEIGAGPWMACNNTYALARDFGWTGVSVERDHDCVTHWRKCRPNDTIIHACAFSLDYKELTGGYVDYLSIDIDPSFASLAVLKMVLGQGVKFKALTFEHDAYCDGDVIRRLSREILKNSGYELAVADVCAPPPGGEYEDWWVRP